MDFQFFIDTLKRHIWLLIGASAAAAIATVLVMVYLVEPTYRANAQLETGIVGFKGSALTRESVYLTRLQVDNAFANLITDMKGRKMMSNLTEILLEHDLTSATPFRTPDPEALEELGDNNLESAKRVLVSRQDSLNTARSPLASTNGVKFSKIAEAYGYDFDELREIMTVSRIGETDYIDVSFGTTNPDLSYFMVTEYIKLFVDVYKRNQSSVEFSDYNFYTNSVERKKSKMDSLQEAINDYRRGNRVVDLEEQQRAVVGQLRGIEEEIEMRRKEINGYEQALTLIKESRLDAGRRTGESRAKLARANTQLAAAQRELNELTNQMSNIEGGSKPLDRLIEAKRAEVNGHIEEVATLKRLGEPKVDERIENLIQQEQDASIELNAARQAVTSMEAEAERLRSRTSGLVNDEAVLSHLTSELSILQEEYKGLNQEQITAEQRYSRKQNPLEIAEPPEYPDEHESRHIPLVAAFSGITTGTLIALGLFLITLLDRSLSSPDQFRALYNREVLTTLTRLNTKKFTLGRLFGDATLPEGPRRYIEGIRSLRYAVEQSNKKIIQITSLNTNAGKSSVAAALAKALTRANQRVLLMDLNFKNNTLSAYANVPASVHPFEPGYDETQLPRAGSWFELDDMDIVGNMAGNRSLAEVLSGVDFTPRLAQLRSQYNYIIVESAALDMYADSRELADHVEGIVCVLDAGEKLDGSARESMAWLESNADGFIGYVLNKVDLKMVS